MTIKIVPTIMKVEMRALMLKYGIMTAVLLFVSISLGDYAVYQWIIGGYGWTIVFGLISFAVAVIMMLIVTSRLAKYEVDLKHAPEKVQIWVDQELLEGGFMTITEFMSRHGAQVMQITRIVNDYLAKDVRKTETQGSEIVSSYHPIAIPPAGGQTKP